MGYLDRLFADTPRGRDDSTPDGTSVIWATALADSAGGYVLVQIGEPIEDEEAIDAGGGAFRFFVGIFARLRKTFSRGAPPACNSPVGGGSVWVRRTGANVAFGFRNSTKNYFTTV